MLRDRALGLAAAFALTATGSAAFAETPAALRAPNLVAISPQLVTSGQPSAVELGSLAGRKVLVHCQVNMRASVMVFLYRVIVAKEDPRIAYDSVTRIWAPEGPWKRLILDELRKNRIDFEPS